MMKDKIKQFRILWLNAKTSPIRKRIRHDWFSQEVDARCLEKYWELVVVGRE